LPVVNSVFLDHWLGTVITFHYDIHKIGKLKDENKRMEIGIIEKRRKWTIMFTYILADAVIINFLSFPLLGIEPGCSSSVQSFYYTTLALFVSQL
jgi:hypothetical protein